jgi:hypothetical protein
MIASAFHRVKYNIELTRQTEENAARRKLARGCFVLGGLTLFLRRLPLGANARNHLAAFAARDPVDFLNSTRPLFVTLPTSPPEGRQSPRRMFFTSQRGPYLPVGPRPKYMITKISANGSRHQHAVGVAATRSSGQTQG